MLLLIEAKNFSEVTVPPLGIAYIAAIVEREGFEVNIIDLNVEELDIEKLKEANLIGISCYTHNYSEALKILKLAKEHKKKVLIGGPHATPLYREVLADGFDFVVLGEGELPVLNLLKGKNIKEIRGLAFKEDGKIFANGVERVKDMDSLPLPARHLLKLKKYSFPGAIATTRGCANLCIFCSSRNQSGTLRARSVPSLLRELKFLKSLRIDSFFVVDPNFAFDRERTLHFCEEVRKLNMSWCAELRLNHMDGEIIESMAASGCKIIRLGIESGSQKVIDAVKKGITISGILDIVANFVKNGIIPVCSFMTGLPTETKEDFNKTLILAKKIKELGGEATFAILTPYPGTYLYKNAEKLGIKILHQNWSRYHHLNPVIETENFTKDELKEMLQLALERIGDVKKRKSFRSIACEVLTKFYK